MVRLLAAVVIGALLAVGATLVVSNVLQGAANGHPVNATLYQYGNR